MITFDDVQVGQLVSKFDAIGQILLKDERDKAIYIEFKYDNLMESLKLWYVPEEFWLLDLYTGAIPDYPWTLKVPSTLTERRCMSDSGVPLEHRSAHYQNMGIDILTFCKANLGDFSGYEGALMLPITKYIWRHKDNRLEDLKKARDFLDLLIAHEEELNG